MRTRIPSPCVVPAVLLALACSCDREPTASAPAVAAAPTATVSREETQATSAALRALEAHLTHGETYGEGPDADVIGAVVRAAVAPGDGVAVKVVPGNPRHVTVLVRYRPTGGYENLRDISQRERNVELDQILDAIDLGYEAGDDVLGVALRGPIAYGAIAVRRPGSPVEYHTGRVIATAPLDVVLTATPGDEPSRVITPGHPPITGRLAPHPRPQPFHHLTLTEPRAIRVQLRSSRPEGEAPFIVLCRGTIRAAQCDELSEVEPTENIPDDVFDQQERWLAQAEARGGFFDEKVYRLPAGPYTLAVFRDECAEGQDECPAATADYDLRLF